MQGVGGAMGAIGGALSNQKEGGKDAGNMFVTPGLGGGQSWDYDAKALQATEDMKGANIGNATSDIQNNGILGQLYGNNGVLSDALSQQKDLQDNGFNLTDTDKTAYGEASGNIARQFGQSDQSLSQALSDRGLSNSGVAGASFSGSAGNKNEQLAGLQTQIAQQRMQMNQQRLAQNQQFLTQLGSQAQGAIQNQVQDRMQNANNQYNMDTGMVTNMQNQANEGLKQQQQTQHGSTLSNAFNGGMQGVMSASGMSSAQKIPTMAGQGSMFAGSMS